MEKSKYYVTVSGRLCITFPSYKNEYPPELFEVVGLLDEARFKHMQIV